MDHSTSNRGGDSSQEKPKTKQVENSRKQKPKNKEPETSAKQKPNNEPETSAKEKPKNNEPENSTKGKPKLLMSASTWSHLSQFHRPYVAEFLRRGWQVTLACPETPTLRQQLPPGVTFFPFPLEKRLLSWQNLVATQKLRKHFAQTPYDLVVCHTILGACFTRLGLWGRKHPPKTIHMVHGYLFHQHSSWWERFLFLGVERFLAPQTHRILTMNQWDTQQATQYALSQDIRQIPGVGFLCSSLESNNPSPNILRDQLSLPKEGFLLVFGGEFSKRKNQEFLIRAMKGLPPHIHLALAGQGGQQQYCQRLVSTLDLTSRVHFLGQVPHLPLWYRAGDLVVSACISEGLPVHLMEAMSQGCGVVVSAIKGHTDLVIPEESGLLFPLGDVSAYQTQVLRMAESTSLRRRLGQEAQRRLADYALPQVFDQVFQSLIF